MIEFFKTVAFNMGRTAEDRPVLFGAVWAFSFAALFVALLSVGMVPSELSGLEVRASEPTIVASETPVRTVPVSAQDLPTRIIIDSVDIDTTVLNPDNPHIRALDEALTEGAVHYPGSGTLEEDANVFIFGHSSYLPTVVNRAFQAFNELGKVKEGDIIRVRSVGREYLYRATKISLANADEVWVDLSRGERKLTLSTCNTFGKKQERFVVEATYLGDYALGA